MNKRKLYWVLLVPSVLIFIVALSLLPESKKNYSVFITLIFWIVYYGVIKINDLKNKQKN
jgi:ABC-type dipeptide/oligopeptide/nickel transport system permease subunit